MTFNNQGGSIQSMSRKQKVNTKSSTEAELVAVDDAIGQILWTYYFLLEQGYKTKTVLHQDNKSAILLEKNGRSSASKRTRHMNIRYFYITDQVEKGIIKIQYCSTHDMVADYLTKPLHGTPWKKMRQQIMNLKKDYKYKHKEIAPKIPIANE